MHTRTQTHAQGLPRPPLGTNAWRTKPDDPSVPRLPGPRKLIYPIGAVSPSHNCRSSAHSGHSANSYGMTEKTQLGPQQPSKPQNYCQIQLLAGQARRGRARRPPSPPPRSQGPKWTFSWAPCGWAIEQGADPHGGPLLKKDQVLTWPRVSLFFSLLFLPAPS